MNLSLIGEKIQEKSCEEMMELKKMVKKYIRKGDFNNAQQILSKSFPPEHWVFCGLLNVYIAKNNRKINLEQFLRMLSDALSYLPKEGCTYCYSCLHQIMDKFPEKEYEINMLVRKNKIQRGPSLRDEMQEKLHSITKKYPIQPDVPSLNSLIYQYRKKGVQCDKVSFYADVRNPQNRLIIANQKILQDEVIISVPYEKFIFCNNIWETPLSKPLTELSVVNQVEKDALFALYLLWHVQLGKASQIGVYIDCLPKKIETFPYYFSEKLLNQLKNTDLYESIIIEQNMIKTDSQLFKKKLKGILEITQESYAWAYFTIASRAFNFMRNGIEEEALIPIVDMMNHRHYTTTIWEYRPNDQIFVVKNQEISINEGEQICTSYGCKGNHNLLFSYGFVEAENRYNKVCVQFEQIKQKPKKILCLKLSRNLNDEAFDTMIKRCRKYVQETKKIPKNGKYFDNREIKVWQYIKKTLEKRLMKYETSLEIDEKLLKHTALNEISLRNCITYRLGEKKILKFFYTMAEQMIDVFSGTMEIDLLNNDYEPYYSLLNNDLYPKEA